MARTSSDIAQAEIYSLESMQMIEAHLEVCLQGTASRTLADDIKLARVVPDHRCEVANWRPPSLLDICIRV